MRFWQMPEAHFLLGFAMFENWFLEIKRQGGEDLEREKNRSSSALLRELPG